MKRRTASIAASFALVALAASAGPTGAEERFDPSAAARGSNLYRAYCVSCHGPRGKGDGPLADDLKVRPADLTALASRNEGVFPYDEVKKVIESGARVRGHGSPDMPAWGDAFRGAEGEEAAAKKVRDLAHYVWSLQPKR